MYCRVRAANELGAGNGEGAKFATIISVVTSNHAWYLLLVIDSDLSQ